MKIELLALLGVLLPGVACNSYTARDQDHSGQIVSANATPDFASVQAQILQPYCISCHSAAGGNSGGVNLENYANVMAAIAQIQDSVIVKGTMPPGHAISQVLQEELTTWIANGEPENTSLSTPPAPTPAATPAPEPLTPTFSSISKNIFIPKCVMCHGPGGTASTLLITDYNFLIKMYWIVPKNLAQSQLYESVNLRRMPPGEKLTQAESDSISQWITAGAKND